MCPAATGNAQLSICLLIPPLIRVSWCLFHVLAGPLAAQGWRGAVPGPGCSAGRWGGIARSDPGHSPSPGDGPAPPPHLQLPGSFLSVHTELASAALVRGSSWGHSSGLGSGDQCSQPGTLCKPLLWGSHSLQNSHVLLCPPFFVKNKSIEKLFCPQVIIVEYLETDEMNCTSVVLWLGVVVQVETDSLAILNLSKSNLKLLVCFSVWHLSFWVLHRKSGKRYLWKKGEWKQIRGVKQSQGNPSVQSASFCSCSENKTTVHMSCPYFCVISENKPSISKTKEDTEIKTLLASPSRINLYKLKLHPVWGVTLESSLKIQSSFFSLLYPRKSLV